MSARSFPSSNPAGFTWSKLVPELLVSDLDSSLRFWADICCFTVAYGRSEDRFAYLDLDGAQLMLEEREAPGRKWITGDLEQPFGRGINFQIAVQDLTAVRNALKAADWPVKMEIEEVWYRAGTIETGVRQFLVQDPDGYLVRFSQHIGARTASKS